jgi:tRNA-dihydrouridine synthase
MSAYDDAKIMTMKITDNLPRPFFALAPMDDVTDTVFRQLIDCCAPPDLYFTEFVNVDGLQSPGREKVARCLTIAASEKSVIAQIWGLTPDNFYKSAQQISDGVFGEFVGIDLNMGCPEKSVVKSGACAGLINNPGLAIEIIEATKAGTGGRLPVSVKTRLGFNKIDMDWIKLLLEQKLDMLTIHGRTRKEMSNVPAHWDAIGQIREMRDQLSLDTLIVGNGDVMDRQHGLELAGKYQLDGIMIGRGVFQDPFIFSANSTWSQRLPLEKLGLYKQHVKLFEETWRPGTRAVYTLNKFCKIYVSGFDGAKELREQLMRAKSTSELLDCLYDAENSLRER